MNALGEVHFKANTWQKWQTDFQIGGELMKISLEQKAK